MFSRFQEAPRKKACPDCSNGFAEVAQSYTSKSVKGLEQTLKKVLKETNK